MTIDASGAKSVRRHGVRAALALAALGVLDLTGFAASGHAQTSAAGMIVIPGRGESAQAALDEAAAHTALAPGKPGSATVRAAPAPAALEPAAVASNTAGERGAAAAGGINAPAPAAAKNEWRVKQVTAQDAPPPAPGTRGAAYHAAAGYQAAATYQAAANRATENRAMAGEPSIRRVSMRVPGAGLPAPSAAGAPPNPAAPAGDEDGETIRRTALAFLRQQTQGLPGKIDVTVAQSFARGLAACPTLEPFLPTGARVWGRTTVGVRCIGGRPWTVYLQARVSVYGTYYVAARQIAPGEPVAAGDLLARDGDLTMLPLAVVTDPSQAVGATALMRVSAGLPLRRDMLKSVSAVSIGQTVRVVAAGAGFSISTEGSALNNASPGQQVRVRTAEGQIITGIVKDAGTVEIAL